MHRIKKIPQKFQLKLKYFIFFGLFLVCPVISTFLPTIKFGITINAIRYFLLPLIFVSLFLIFEKQISLKKNSIAFVYLTYTLYSAINEFGHLGHITLTLLLSNIILVLYLILINGIRYNENDIRIFQSALIYLSIVVSIVGLIQYFIKPSFWMTKNITSYFNPLYEKAFADKFRIRSIFSNIGIGEGWIFIGMLSIVLLFMLFEKRSIKSSIMVIFVWLLSLISVFITFTRGIWVMSIIGILVFLYYKIKIRQKTIKYFIIILVFMIILFGFIYPKYWESIERSDLYNTRVLSSSYLSRVETYKIFLTKSWSENILFGFGVEYPDELVRKYGHNVRSLNSFFGEYIKGGLIGAILFISVYLLLFKKAKRIYKISKNPVGFALILSLIAVNLNTADKYLFYLPYLFIFLYLEMYYQIAKKKLILLKTNNANLI